MSRLPEYFIYSDGACKGNPGPGGYGTLVLTMKELDFTEVGRFARGYFDTTNNRMELMGVIRGLMEIKKPSTVVVITDSKYIVDAINKKWLNNWLRNGWMTKTDKPVKNKDLWLELIKQMKIHNVTFQWVKGHSDNEYNNICDKLAVDASHNPDSIDVIIR